MTILDWHMLIMDNLSNSWSKLWDHNNFIDKNKKNYEIQLSVNNILKDEIEK
jgi:hypothetical protein